MPKESVGRQRFLHVEIPIRPRPRPKAKTTTTTKTTATKVAATPITTTTVTSAYREKPPTQTSPRSRYRSSGTPRAAAALISSLPRALKEKLYRHETIEILDAVVIPYSKKKERACQEQASSLKPCQGHNKQGSSRNLTSYARKPSSSSASLSEATRRRTLIVSSDEDSGLEHQSDEDHEEEEGLNMSSLLRNTIRVAQKRSRQTKSPTQGKSKAASSGRSNHRNINKLRKRLLEEVELDEDAGIGQLPSKRTRNQANSSFRRRLERRLQSKGAANAGYEESSSDSSEGSDDSSDDSDIPDSQGNIADFVVEDNEEEARIALAQIPERFRRDQDQNPKNDFKLYIEYLFWLIFDKHALDQDSKYIAPVQRIMKILSTYQSTLSSSGRWSPDFLSQVNQRPKLRKVNIVDEEETSCAACKITSHKAQSAVTLFGAEYKPPMKPSELDRFCTMFSPDTGTQRIDTNGDGQEFRFKLGTTCTKRSMLYHEVRHFSYHCVWKIIRHCTKGKTDNRPGLTLEQRLAQKQRNNNDSERVDPARLVATLQGVTSKLWDEFDELKTGLIRLHSTK
ncbi:hypothetical protein CPB97_011034 [Podila verticillata]|nr:hypothetical protein CPB97_011034 [Podila verticillata]